MKLIINENKPIASVKAKPNIAKENKSDLRDGFLDVAETKLPNIIPAPIAAPVNPIVAIAPAINLAAINILSIILYILT